jgi:hypothetical protein
VRPPARAGAAAIALALCGCSTVSSLSARLPFIQPQPQPTPAEGSWARVRDRFTASAKLYDGLSTRAFVSAVYQAPEVREARVARLAEWRELGAQERDALLAAERDEAAQYEDFLVSLFTADRADNDLDAAKSVWRVALTVAGEGQAEPLKIQQMRPDATLRTLYPVIGDFDTVYLVRFARWPKGPLAERQFVLRIAGARGRMDLAFPNPAQSRSPLVSTVSLSCRSSGLGKSRT